MVRVSAFGGFFLGIPKNSAHVLQIILDKHEWRIYRDFMKRKIVKIQKVRGLCLITIPGKIARGTGFDKSDYAAISINAYGDLIIRRLEDGSEEKKALPGSRDWFDRPSKVDGSDGGE